MAKRRTLTVSHSTTPLFVTHEKAYFDQRRGLNVHFRFFIFRNDLRENVDHDLGRDEDLIVSNPNSIVGNGERNHVIEKGFRLVMIQRRCESLSKKFEQKEISERPVLEALLRVDNEASHRNSCQTKGPVWILLNDFHSIEALTLCELKTEVLERNFGFVFTVLSSEFDGWTVRCFGHPDIEVFEFSAFEKDRTGARFDFCNVCHDFEITFDIEFAFSFGMWDQLDQIEHQMAITSGRATCTENQNAFSQF